MTFHNHEENIAVAREWIDTFKKHSEGCHSALSPASRDELICLLQSFVEDALIGHRRIEDLEESVEELENEVIEKTNLKTKLNEKVKQLEEQLNYESIM